VPESADQLIRIAAILIGGGLLAWLARWAIGRFEQRIASADSHRPDQSLQRARTLSGVLRAVAVIVIWVVAVIMALEAAGVAIGPLIAAAGIGGIAIGFGAQSLVKDFFSGFFMVMERQLDVGDVVEVAGVQGAVETLGLRTTVVRSLDGSRHVVPNGEIRVTTNHTKEFSRYLIDLPVPYERDTDEVARIAGEVVERMRAETRFRGVILGPATILGVDDYADSSVNLRMYLETQPGKQWEAGREFRRRMKAALEQAGIGIPYPHREVIVRTGSRDDAALQELARAGERR
jgi:moderate conductance mechanosensitive channel